MRQRFAVADPLDNALTVIWFPDMLMLATGGLVLLDRYIALPEGLVAVMVADCPILSAREVGLRERLEEVVTFGQLSVADLSVLVRPPAITYTGLPEAMPYADELTVTESAPVVSVVPMGVICWPALVL